MSAQMYETCRTFVPVGLRADERHCCRCHGAGVLPIDPRDYSMTRFYPPSCDSCSGTGKES